MGSILSMFLFIFFKGYTRRQGSWCSSGLTMLEKRHCCTCSETTGWDSMCQRYIQVYPALAHKVRLDISRVFPAFWWILPSVLSIGGADHSWNDVHDIWPRGPYARWKDEKCCIIMQSPIQHASLNRKIKLFMCSQHDGSGRTTSQPLTESSTWWTVPIMSD